MIPRLVGPHVTRLARQYPVVTITGPRQSGKTTLVRAVFPDRAYASLELPEVRAFALEDPRGFLNQFPDGAVLDEAQRAPDLFSYIQTIVDERDEEGLFILTGSAQFLLLEKITQSLAGRTAIVQLLPFSFPELAGHVAPPTPLDTWLYTGFYPRIYDKHLDPTEALGFYVHSYVERDVRTLLNVKDLATFERFLRACAARTARVLNLSSIANDCGINHNTAGSWLSILEASYIVHRVGPHFRDFSKRLRKAPKLYFCDVGLAAYLLGITKPEQLTAHPLRGELFETFVVSELLKARYNAVQASNLFYFRDNVGNEVDVLQDHGDRVVPIEIKSGETFASDMVKGLRYYQRLAGDAAVSPALIYGGAESFVRDGVNVVSFRQISKLAAPT